MRGLNSRPLACEASVITTTPTRPVTSLLPSLLQCQQTPNTYTLSSSPYTSNPSSSPSSSISPNAASAIVSGISFIRFSVDPANVGLSVFSPRPFASTLFEPLRIRRFTVENRVCVILSTHTYRIRVISALLQQQLRLLLQQPSDLTHVSVAHPSLSLVVRSTGMNPFDQLLHLFIFLRLIFSLQPHSQHPHRIAVVEIQLHFVQNRQRTIVVALLLQLRSLREPEFHVLIHPR